MVTKEELIAKIWDTEFILGFSCGFISSYSNITPLIVGGFIGYYVSQNELLETLFRQ